MNEFAHLSVEGKRDFLAQRLEQEFGTSAVAPLSFTQERLWFLNELQPDQPNYSIARAFRLRGVLDVAALERALNEVVQRHDSLRTSVRMVGGQPMQVIAPRIVLPLRTADLRHAPAAERESLARNHIQQEAARAFDLAEAPLLRCSLFRLDEEEHKLLLTMHHMVFDGWSIAVLYRELDALYGAFASGKPSPLPDLPIQYPDYVVWQRERLQGAVLEDLLAFWKDELGDAPAVVELPTDRPRPPVQTFAGARYHVGLSDAEVEDLNAFGRREGVTLFMTLFAAFSVLIQRYTGQDDIVIGSPFANRTRVETENLIGFFVNNLVMRIRLTGDPTFRELLARVRKSALDAYGHQDVPFHKLVESMHANRDLSRNPLFQVMFALQNDLPLELQGLRVSPAEVGFATAPVDLMLAMSPTPTGFGSFIYNVDLFDESTIARMAEHYKTLLRELVSKPERPLSDAAMLTGSERRHILAEWNRTAQHQPSPSLIQVEFEAQVARTPNAVALVGENTQLTYEQLNRRSNQLAHYLRSRGVGAETVVALYSARTPETVVGLLGILKAGGAYLPLEPTYPRERIGLMLADAAPLLLLTQQRHASELPTESLPVVYLDGETTPINQEPEENPATTISEGNLAYVIYTSGSTGKPKGVMISHRSVSNFILGMDQALHEPQAGTWLAATGISFDISVLELLWTLCRGFQVILPADPLRTLTSAASPAPAVRPVEFSLFYFADDGDKAAQTEKYRLLLEGARFADQHDFTAIWTPERHFHSFGGPYVNPSVTGAALAMITKRIQIRAGSVVLPLHHPIRVAEEWSVVDNLSNGRIGVSFASGWQTNDFVLAPENYAERKEVMLSGIESVRRLWRGEVVSMKDQSGQELSIRSFPRPIQPELPFWITAAGSPESFRSAGQVGANLLTHLLGQSIDELAQKIRLYREARERHGHDGRGHVTLMLHAFVGDDRERVLKQVREPLANYLRSSFDLLKARGSLAGPGTNPEQLSAEDSEALLEHGIGRYLQGSGLFGTVRDGVELVRRLQAIGVDEVACLVDFGLEFDDVMNGLEQLALLRKEVNTQFQATGAALPLDGVTHLQCTPSLARMVMAAPSGFATLPGLKKLLLGGEALPTSLAADIATTTAGQIWNMYGPTETTVWSSASSFGRAGKDSTVPIGAPIANTQFYVLDKRLEPVPIGIAGELFIGGKGLARGYWGAPALSSARFLPDPFSDEAGARMYRTGDLVRWRADGTIDFLGRTDHQIKINGYRVELAEVELGLQNHAAIREAAVAVDESTGYRRLIAYVVLEESAGRASSGSPLRPVRNPETFADLQSRTLPNGMPILHHNASHSTAVFREVFADRCYMQSGITLPDNACVIDAGANIGLFTLFVNQECSNPKVFAIEPVPPNFALLQANRDLYGLRNVTVLNCGLSDKEEVADFIFYPNMAGMSARSGFATEARSAGRAMIVERLRSPGGSVDSATMAQEIDTFLEQQYQSETYTCRLSTVSRIIEDHGIQNVDLLKVDVEGSEVLVLSGITNQHWSRIRQVVLEVHSKALLEQVTTILQERGFHVTADELPTHRDHPDGSDVFAAHVYARRPGENASTKSAHSLQDSFLSATLSAFLRERLPEHMIPSDYVVMSSLPLTPNGKLDRGALSAPEPDGDAPERKTTFPESSIERVISSIWAKVLHADRIEANANFFDLGGTSLRMIEVLASLRTQLSGNAPSLVDLFRYPTVRSLADHLRHVDERSPELNPSRRGQRELNSRRARLQSYRSQAQARGNNDRE